MAFIKWQAIHTQTYSTQTENVIYDLHTFTNLLKYFFLICHWLIYLPKSLFRAMTVSQWGQ